MLVEASLQNARQLRFECTACMDEVTPYPVTYSYQFAAGPDWPCPESHQHSTQPPHRVTVIAEPRVVHPFLPTLKFDRRSVDTSGDAALLGADGNTIIFRSVARSVSICGTAAISFANHMPPANDFTVKSGEKIGISLIGPDVQSAHGLLETNFGRTLRFRNHLSLLSHLESHASHVSR
jgi:hypothetical protein